MELNLLKKAFHILFISSFAFSAIKGSESERSIKNQLKKQKLQIHDLKNEIVRLEKKLGQNNDNFVRTLQRVKKLETKVYDIREKHQKIINNIDYEKERLTKLIDGHVLRVLSKDQSSDNLLVEKVSIKAMILSRENLVNLKKQHVRQKKDFENLNNRLSEYRQNEQYLNQFILELENKKQTLSERYLETKKSYSLLENKLAKTKARQKLTKAKTKSKVDILMLSPLKNFKDMQHGKKGITYKFHQREPVLVSATGKVSYIGRLANYGRLVMVDHGDNIRSIFLGDYTTKIKQGQSVSKGDILGYTRKGVGSLYFEVRRKDTALKTISWLDEKSFKI